MSSSPPLGSLNTFLSKHGGEFSKSVKSTPPLWQREDQDFMKWLQHLPSITWQYVMAMQRPWFCNTVACNATSGKMNVPSCMVANVNPGFRWSNSRRLLGWWDERWLKSALDSTMVKGTVSSSVQRMKGLWGGGGQRRFPARGKKCWRIRERDCLRVGSVVSQKWCVEWGNW